MQRLFVSNLDDFNLFLSRTEVKFTGSTKTIIVVPTLPWLTVQPLTTHFPSLKPNCYLNWSATSLWSGLTLSKIKKTLWVVSGLSWLMASGLWALPLPLPVKCWLMPIRRVEVSPLLSWPSDETGSGCLHVHLPFAVACQGQQLRWKQNRFYIKGEATEHTKKHK